MKQKIIMNYDWRLHPNKHPNFCWSVTKLSLAGFYHNQTGVLAMCCSLSQQEGNKSVGGTQNSEMETKAKRECTKQHTRRADWVREIQLSTLKTCKLILLRAWQLFGTFYLFMRIVRRLAVTDAQHSPAEHLPVRSDCNCIVYARLHNEAPARMLPISRRQSKQWVPHWCQSATSLTSRKIFYFLLATNANTEVVPQFRNRMWFWYEVKWPAPCFRPRGRQAWKLKMTWFQWFHCDIIDFTW